MSAAEPRRVRVCKQPRRGEHVELMTGPCRVTRVSRGGVTIDAVDSIGRTHTATRAVAGHWTVVAAPDQDRSAA